MSRALLPSAYFGPIQWYQKLCHYSECIVESNDNFIKQTYRNRCHIATANGVQSLSVPVEKSGKTKCPMKDVRISEHNDWRHLHWNALRTAYGESPFFEFYADDIHPFFEKRWAYLLDFNLEITGKICTLLDIDTNFRPSTVFLNKSDLNGIDDFRDVIHPKHPLPDTSFQPRKYHQVYEQKTGFIPNLSILDLLFNEGNEAVFYL